MDKNKNNYNNIMDNQSASSKIRLAREHTQAICMRNQVNVTLKVIKASNKWNKIKRKENRERERDF